MLPAAYTATPVGSVNLALIAGPSSPTPSPPPAMVSIVYNCAAAAVANKRLQAEETSPCRLTEGRMAGIGVVLKDLDGKKHGRWVTRGSSGDVEIETYVNDEKQ